MRITIGHTQLEIVQGDITLQKVDAIVNAANSELQGGGGVNGAIHRAGGSSILEECRKIRNTQGRCMPGEAIITNAGHLKAKYVIHAVGPIWQGGSQQEDQCLRNAYWRSLELADQHKISTIAFPSISTGIYGFPINRAAQVAMEAIRNYLKEHPNTLLTKISLITFSEYDKNIYDAALSAINSTQGTA